MGSKTVRREACHTKCWGHGFGAGREEIFVLTLTPTALWRCRSVCSFICSLLCVQQEQWIYTAVLALILLMWMKEYACQRGLNINVFSFLQLINYLGTSFSFVKGKQSPVWTPWLGTGCFLWHCLLSSWDRRHWSPLVGFSVPFPPFPKLLFHTFALFFFFFPLCTFYAWKFRILHEFVWEYMFMSLLHVHKWVFLYQQMKMSRIKQKSAFRFLLWDEQQAVK